MPGKQTELILNANGSVYHLNLRPGDIADTVIFVGDPDRVERVSKHFDSIEVRAQKREFKTHTGYLGNKRLSVISTGIGSGNIDIVLNELDALVNLNLKTLQVNDALQELKIVRIGTSGAIQPHIEVDSFLMSAYAIDCNNTLHFYKTKGINQSKFSKAIAAHLQSNKLKIKPLVVRSSKALESIFNKTITQQGVTLTTPGFYAPQGRKIRLPLKEKAFINKLQGFKFKQLQITNIEMETAPIYGLSKLLSHKAISVNAILANRITGKFSTNPEKTIDKLIALSLENIQSAL